MLLVLISTSSVAGSGLRNDNRQGSALVHLKNPSCLLVLVRILKNHKRMFACFYLVSPHCLTLFDILSKIYHPYSTYTHEFCRYEQKDKAKKARIHLFCMTSVSLPLQIPLSIALTLYSSFSSVLQFGVTIYFIRSNFLHVSEGCLDRSSAAKYI